MSAFTKEYWRSGDAAFALLCAALVTATFSISLFVISSVSFLVLSIMAWSADRRLFYKNLFFALVAIYFVLNFASVFRSDFPENSWRGLFKVSRHVLLCASAAFIVHSPKRAKTALYFLLGASAFVLLDGILQHFTGREFIAGRTMTPYIGAQGRLTGPFHHANDFAAFLSLVLFPSLSAALAGDAFKPKTRTVFFVVFLAGLACLLGTLSRGAWIAVFLAFAAMAALKRNRGLLIFLFCLSVWGAFFSPADLRGRALSLFDPRDNTVEERKWYFQESLELVKRSPWIGLGVNTYSKTERLYKPVGSKADNMYAHNGYMQMAAEIGLLGVLSFIAVFFIFFAKAGPLLWRHPDPQLKALGTGFLFGIAAFLMHSATDTNLHSLLLISLYWLCLGVLWGAAVASPQEPARRRSGAA